MSVTPEPRPALHRATDGSVHPATPTTKSAGSSQAAEPFTGKPVRLAVEVPKKLRKSLRETAEASGRSVDDVVVQALTLYLRQTSNGKR